MVTHKCVRVSFMKDYNIIKINYKYYRTNIITVILYQFICNDLFELLWIFNLYLISTDY